MVTITKIENKSELTWDVMRGCDLDYIGYMTPADFVLDPENLEALYSPTYRDILYRDMLEIMEEAFYYIPRGTALAPGYYRVGQFGATRVDHVRDRKGSNVGINLHAPGVQGGVHEVHYYEYTGPRYWFKIRVDGQTVGGIINGVVWSPDVDKILDNLAELYSDDDMTVTLEWYDAIDGTPYTYDTEYYRIRNGILLDLEQSEAV